jgi:hypothetical protein
VNSSPVRRKGEEHLLAGEPLEDPGRLVRRYPVVF